MKKLLVVLALLFSVPAFAHTPIRPRPVPVPQYTRGYQQGYNIGYNNGNSHAKQRAWAIAGASVLVVIGGIIIYEAGRESSWTVSENGVGYRF